jgi:hypothetical protein
MSTATVVAIVFVAMFIIGIVVGIIVVIALSAVRRDRRYALTERARQDGLEDYDAPEYTYGASGVPGHWDGINPDAIPYWPGALDDASSGE